jgi:hypothetical protein
VLEDIWKNKELQSLRRYFFDKCFLESVRNEKESEFIHLPSREHDHRTIRGQIQRAFRIFFSPEKCTR